MRNIQWFKMSITSSLSMIFVLCGSIEGSEPGVNLIKNPGFEESSGDNAIDWDMQQGAWANGGNARVDKTEIHSGKQSLLLEQTHPIEVSEEALNLPSWEDYSSHLIQKKQEGFVIVTQNVPVEAGKHYNFSFWYKVSDLYPEHRDPGAGRGYALFQVYIFWLDENGKLVSNGVWVVSNAMDADDWVQVNNSRFASPGSGESYKAPEGTITANVRFQLPTSVAGKTPKAWIDDVHFEEGR